MEKSKRRRSDAQFLSSHTHIHVHIRFHVPWSEPDHRLHRDAVAMRRGVLRHWKLHNSYSHDKVRVVMVGHCSRCNPFERPSWSPHWPSNPKAQGRLPRNRHTWLCRDRPQRDKQLGRTDQRTYGHPTHTYDFVLWHQDKPLLKVWIPFA